MSKDAVPADSARRGELPEEDAAAHFETLSIEELRGRRNNKWTLYGDDVLAAWVAEMDCLPPPAVRAALHEAIERGGTGYAPAPAASGLPAACAAWLASRHGMAVDPAQIRLVPDVMRGITLAIELFSRPRSPVVVLTPAYGPFFEAVRAVRRRLVEAPMAWCEEQHRYVIDLDAVDAALRAGAGTVLLCNPHNPLGRAFTREELAALAGVVEAHGARVIADEVHAPLQYPGARHVSYAASDAGPTRAAGHSVTLLSCSKGWNVPGLKCAQIVLTNPADNERWEKVSYLKSSGASTLGILANRVAYEQGGPWLDGVMRYIDGNRTLLAKLMAKLLPGVRYVPPEVTYLAWLDCRALGLSNPARFFLERAKVALADGATFGAPGRGFVRLNFATSRAILTAIVQRMAAALAEGEAAGGEL
jgi:cystathionine beta-lyase